DKEGLFILEGYNLFNEIKNSNLIVDILENKEDTKYTFCNEGEIKKISDSKNPQKIIVICKKPLVKKIGKKVLYLDFLQDPGNVGTLIRSAVAFGFTDVVIEGVDPFNPKVVRSSLGSIFKINIIKINKDIDKKNIFKNKMVLGTHLSKDSINYNEFNFPEELILIIGNESNGINENIFKYVDHNIIIPIEFESLNAAVAGSIIMNKIKENT
ncbi:MAG: RNA methyltransferase, partial [Mollicutes bacterium PWAP]|nr:RNA methyltransferase [Mollicutes bacterium PWAP]